MIMLYVVDEHDRLTCFCYMLVTWWLGLYVKIFMLYVSNWVGLSYVDGYGYDI